MGRSGMGMKEGLLGMALWVEVAVEVEELLWNETCTMQVKYYCVFCFFLLRPPRQLEQLLSNV